jgi:hypothetical protein
MQTCKKCLVETRAQQNLHTEDEFLARGIEPSLSEVMDLLPKGPYLWSNNVSAILERLEGEEKARAVSVRGAAA